MRSYSYKFLCRQPGEKLADFEARINELASEGYRVAAVGDSENHYAGLVYMEREGQAREPSEGRL